MKKLGIILILLVLIQLFTTCNDWLDISVRTEVKGDILFTSERGYQRALTGVYLLMGEQSLYGEIASMGFPEMLARMWTFPDRKFTTPYLIAHHQYNEDLVKSDVKSLVASYYKVIAHVNSILSYIEGSTVVFNNNNDKLIKGEAFGLRAFLHFELLRYFGAIPSQAQGEAKTIPYVTEVTTDIRLLRTKNWTEVITAIEQDLNLAEEQLKEVDPIIFLSIEQLGYPDKEKDKDLPVDNWQHFRQSRLNYYGILGLKARFYNWIGDKEQAVHYAKMVVDSKKFELCTENYFGTTAQGDNTNNSLTMYKEYLFGLHHSQIYKKIEKAFVGENPKYTQQREHVDRAYEKTTHPDDIRYVRNRYWADKRLGTGSKTIYQFYKYTGNETIKSDSRVPLLRYVEMYFILMQNLPLAEAKEYFVAYRQARALSFTIDDETVSSQQAMLQRLEKEYRKEFYGEGQMFFFYKKHNYREFSWPEIYEVPEGAYVLPLPKEITDYEI